MPRQTARGPALIFVTAALFAAAATGLMAAVLPLVGVVAVGASGLVALILLLVRRGFPRTATAATTPPQAEAGGMPAAPGEDPAVRERDLRWPRLLFYAGTLALTESTFRPALGLTISEMFFIASFGGCCFAVLSGHRLARVPASLVAGVCVFVFGGAISSFAARSPGSSASEVLHAVYVMLLWTWTATMVIRTRRQLALAVGLWGLSAAVNGAAAIAQVFGQGVAGARATGFTIHPNDLGGATAVALVPALALATRRVPARGRSSPAWRWVVVALIAAGIVLSGSVSAMLAGLIGTVVWLSSPLVRIPARVAAVVCTVVAGGALALAVEGGQVISPTHRIEQVTGAANPATGSGSGQTRIEMWRAAWSQIERNPIVGRGLDPAGTGVPIITAGYSSVQAVHGAPIAVWYEGGLFAFLGFAAVVWALAAAGWRGLRAVSGSDDSSMGWALLAAFVAWVVFAATGPFYFQQYGWISGVMLVAWRGRRDFLARPAATVAAAPPATPAVLRGTLAR